MIPSLRSEWTTGPGGRRARFALPALLLILTWACGPAREHFADTHASPEALTETFLGALEARDRPVLEGLALSEEEFRLEVFPEMPAYGNIPPDLAWSQLAARSLYGLSSVLAAHGGRSWELEELIDGGETSVYQSFVVHRDPMLRLRCRSTGERREMALFGSFLEHRGRFKLVSFNLDR